MQQEKTETKTIKENLATISSWSHIFGGIKRFFTGAEDKVLKELQAEFQHLKEDKVYPKSFFVKLNKSVLAQNAYDAADDSRTEAYSVLKYAESNHSSSKGLNSYFSLQYAKLDSWYKNRAADKAKQKLFMEAKNFALEKLRYDASEEGDSLVLSILTSFMPGSALKGLRSKFSNPDLTSVSAPTDFNTNEILKKYSAYKVINFVEVNKYINEANDKDTANFISADKFMEDEKEKYKPNPKNQWRLGLKLADEVSKELKKEIKQCDYDILCAERDAAKASGGAKYVLAVIKERFWSLFYKANDPKKTIGEYKNIKSECQKKSAAIKNAKPRWWWFRADKAVAKDNFMLQVQVGREYVEEFKKVDFLPTVLEKQVFLEYFQEKKAADNTTITPNKMPMLAGAGCLRLCESLLNSVDDEDKPRMLDAKDKDRYTPLMLAVIGGHVGVVGLLLQEGAGINVVGGASGIDTALMIAAANNNIEILELLLSKGANIIVSDNDGMNYSALDSAADNGHIHVVKLLLDRGADIDSKNYCDITSLMTAAINGYTDVVKLLLDRGASTDVKVLLNETALMVAANNGHIDVVKLLLGKGAEIDARDYSKKTALMMAANNGHINVVKMLLASEAGINVQASDGQTALMFAAKKGCIDVVEFLLEKGADANIQAVDKKGSSKMTAKYYAEKKLKSMWGMSSKRAPYEKIISLLDKAEAEAMAIANNRRLSSEFKGKQDEPVILSKSASSQDADPSKVITNGLGGNKY